MREIDLAFDEILSADFTLYDNNPVIKHFGVSPIVADPCVLTPDFTHDNKWHLFCHSLFGVYSFSSADGINWKNDGIVIKNAMRPDCVYVDGVYYLYYEKTENMLKKALSLVGGKWHSEICLVTSTDLVNWTAPTTIISHDRSYMTSRLGTSISNPFITKVDDKFRLYFSAGLTYIKDCGFSEPTHISYAESDSLTGGFVTLENPIISPDKNSEFLNLCSGCIKVYKLKDCYIALQNGIFKKGLKSHSAIMLLHSLDGKTFEFKKTMLAPTVTNCKNKNWMKQYVYACSLVKQGNTLRLYFNARNCADNIRGRENIGFTEATLKK